jgi:hypothetical protein
MFIKSGLISFAMRANILANAHRLWHDAFTMKRNMACFAFCYLTAAMLSAAAAVTHKMAHTPTACAANIGSCPPEGCGGGDPKLNTKKNRLDSPAETPELWTFQEILHLEQERPTQWMEGQDRTEVENMGEDTPIRLTGYLFGAHAGGPETCNCKLSGPENNDIHINIVQTSNDKITDSIVTEMTPRVRAAHPGWDKAQDLLDQLTANGQKPYVQVTGYLMFDSEHVARSGGPRATIWEIHPVTAFEVCTSASAAVCDKGNNWVALENWKGSAGSGKSGKKGKKR